MSILHHLTLNSGDMARTPRADVSQTTIDHLLPLIDNEAGEFPALGVGFDIYRPLNDDNSAIDGAAIFNIVPSPDTADFSYAICVGCWKEEMSGGAWHRLREVYGPWTGALQAVGLWKPMAEEPPPAPWLAVILLPTIMLLDRDRIGMLGDMERCLFWALAEGSGS